MTVQERLTWVKRLNIVQFVINLIYLAVFMVFGGIVLVPPMVAAISGDTTGLLVGLVAALIILIALIIGGLHAALPLIANFALSKRQKGWTWAAYGILLYSAVTGGGIFTILSLISLVLLIDDATHEYLTGSPWSAPKTSSSTDATPMP